jgi:hypothetical protein
MDRVYASMTECQGHGIGTLSVNLRRGGKKMTNQEIQETATKFFEKYKKTEGDRTLWSAPWKIYVNGQTFEIIFSTCPKGTFFKIFVDNKKMEEIWEWPVFLEKLDELEKTYAPLFDRDNFFGQMQEMV